MLLPMAGSVGVPRMCEAMRTVRGVGKEVRQGGAACVAGPACQRCQEGGWRQGVTGRPRSAAI